MNDSIALLETRNLRLKRGAQVLLERLDWQGKPGEFWGVLGGNGAGKTTLLETVCGLSGDELSPDSGAVLLSGHSLARTTVQQRALHVAFLSQQPEVNQWATVEELALTGRYPYGPAWSAPTADDRQRTAALLEQLDLLDKKSRRVSELSGGELQRLRLVTVLLQDTPLLVLDEPVNHLDLRHQIQLLDHIADLAQNEEKAVVAALHDLNLARRYCSHILMLDGAGGSEQGRVEEMMTAERLSKLYQHPVVLMRGVHGSAFAPGES